MAKTLHYVWGGFKTNVVQRVLKLLSPSLCSESMHIRNNFVQGAGSNYMSGGSDLS